MKYPRKLLRAFPAANLIAVCVLSLGLQQAWADDPGTAGQLSSRDYKFATAAVEGGRMEVSLGLMAVQKAYSSAVRDFGQLMVDDHQRAGAELAKILTQKGATVPDMNSKKDDKLTTHLQGLTGTAFDTAYIKAMVRDHKKDLKEFQTAADKSDDADLRAWAAKTAPMVQEHLRRAQAIEKPATVAAARANAQP